MFSFKAMLQTRGWLAMIVLSVAVVLGACGGGEAPAPEMATEPIVEMATEPIVEEEPRVFFVAPLDDTDHPAELPLAFEFGSEGFEISPVPNPLETVRSDVGHFHLGVDAECLPAGEIVPQSAPWVHFGDGSNTIEVSLEPGEHTFSVQIGDDEHRTLEGLCETITVRIEEGI
jgi:hypothetical protein